MRNILATLLLAGASTVVLAEDQIITPNPLTQDAAAGSAVSIGIDYNTIPPDPTLTGLGLRVHFDSSSLTFASSAYGPDGDGFSQPVSGPTDDATDFDNDPKTDQFIILSWVDLSGNFPGVDPATIATVNFTTAADFTESTQINFSASSTAAGFVLGPNSAIINSGTGPVGPGPAPTPIPDADLVNLPSADAEAALMAAGFTVSTVPQVSATATPGTVLSVTQDPATRTAVLTIATAGPVGPPVVPPLGPVQPVPSISSFGLLLLTPLLGLVAMFKRKK
ncbi:MAG: PASTA domain-containing protein [Methylococcales bacterium]